MLTSAEHLDLMSAIVIISLALCFYTIGVWGERIQKNLKFWHIIFFILGIVCDISGTSLMAKFAHMTGDHNTLHTVTGLSAVILMLIHAVWALWTYFRGSEKNRRNFNKFSILVWTIWLIPYFIGMYIGMSH